jgi:hypothetical protein
MSSDAHCAWIVTTRPRCEAQEGKEKRRESSEDPRRSMMESVLGARVRGRVLLFSPFLQTCDIAKAMIASIFHHCLSCPSAVHLLSVCFDPEHEFEASTFCCWLLVLF